VVPAAKTATPVATVPTINSAKGTATGLASRKPKPLLRAAIMGMPKPASRIRTKSQKVLLRHSSSSACLCNALAANPTIAGLHLVDDDNHRLRVFIEFNAQKLGHACHQGSFLFRREAIWSHFDVHKGHDS
jgi:hypothetical protein